MALARALRCSPLALLVALLGLVSPRARAAELGLIDEHFRARGASRVLELGRGFLFEGQSIAHAQRLGERG
jgi:hypothetical protein